MKDTDRERTHGDRFRCPQCGRIVTVTGKLRPTAGGGKALTEFDCTMQGMCGSPLWDPCPMYLSYMERTELRPR